MSRLVVAVGNTVLSLMALCSLTALGGCQDRWWHNVPGYGGYWWQRGQTKSVSTLLTEARARFDTSLQTYGAERKEIAPAAQTLQSALGKVVESARTNAQNPNLAEDLKSAERAMLSLEGKLSVGSRAAYGELAAQLRVFADEASSGRTPSYAPFGLFASRTYRFLASELSMPAPVL